MRAFALAVAGRTTSTDNVSMDRKSAAAFSFPDLGRTTKRQPALLTTAGPGRVRVIGAEHHNEIAGVQGQAIVEGVVKAVVGGRNVLVEDVVKGTEKVAGAIGRSVIEDDLLYIKMASLPHRPQGFGQAVGGVQARRQNGHQGPVWVV